MKIINGIEVQDYEVVDTEKVSKVATFIINWIWEHNFDKLQMFDSRNITGDYMQNILVDTEMKIMIDYSDYGYLEIFGATKSEFKMICEWCKMMQVYAG